MPSAAGDRPPPGRHERRKTQTRDRLMLAARELLAHRGADATRINEITEAADVGFGSFYNHFGSKEAIVAAVVEAVARELGDTIAATTADFDDPAEVMSIAHRTIIRQAVADPTRGWLMVRLELSHDLVSVTLGPCAIRDLQRGVDEARFVVADQSATLVAIGGALLGTVRAILQGRLCADTDVAHAAAVLQLLGLVPADAFDVASRPLPRIAGPPLTFAFGGHAIAQASSRGSSASCQ